MFLLHILAKSRDQINWRRAKTKFSSPKSRIFHWFKSIPVYVSTIIDDDMLSFNVIFVALRLQTSLEWQIIVPNYKTWTQKLHLFSPFWCSSFWRNLLDLLTTWERWDKLRSFLFISDYDSFLLSTNDAIANINNSLKWINLIISILAKICKNMWYSGI